MAMEGPSLLERKSAKRLTGLSMNIVILEAQRIYDKEGPLSFQEYMKKLPSNLQETVYCQLFTQLYREDILIDVMDHRAKRSVEDAIGFFQISVLKLKKNCSWIS